MKKRLLSLLLALVMLVGMIPATTLTAFAAITDVPFTSDSNAVPGSSMTVDLDALAEQDEAFMEAYFNNSVIVTWYLNGTKVTTNISGSFGETIYLTVDDGGKSLYVTIEADGNTYTSKTFVVETLPDVYVGGVGMNNGDYLAVGATATQTTKPSGGYAYYKDGTLTLNNYSYEGKGYQYNSEDSYYATVFTEQDLTLELVGTNSLKQTASLSDGINVFRNLREGDLTIRGDGSLNVTGTYSGICAQGTLTVNGGTIISTGTDGGKYSSRGISSEGKHLIINGGNVTASGDYGLRAQSGYCEINGGNVTATGTDRAIAYGSWLTVAEGMKIQASTTADGELGEYIAENHASYKKIVVRSAPEVYVGGVGLCDGDYLAVGATTTQTTKPSGGYAYYYDGTLTLNNYSYEGKGYMWDYGGYYACIYGPTSLNIVLNGSSRITQTGGDTCDCMYSPGDVVVSGTGSLTLTDGYSGIYAESNVTIDGGTITVQDVSAGIISRDNITVNGGAIHVTSEENSLTGSAGITINGGELTLVSTNTVRDSTYYAMCSDSITIADGLEVQASTDPDGTLVDYVAADNNTYDRVVISAPGVYVGGVAMYDGDFLAVGATATQTTKPSGGYAYYEDGKLTLNNYSYEGEGYKYARNNAYYAIVYAERDLTLVLVGNNTLKQTKEYSEAIYADNSNLTIQGDGSLNATASYGIYARNTLTVNGGTIISTGSFCGMRSFMQDIIINGGTVTVSGEYGLRAMNGSVKINGGTITAIGGGSKAISYGSSGSFTVAEGMKIQASTTVDGELGEYVAANHDSYKKIVITPPDVYVGGVGMCDGDYLAVGATETTDTQPSGGYAYYKNSTLTLNNYSYEGDGYEYDSLYGFYTNYAVIYSKNDLTLELIGNNTLNQTESSADMIYVDGAKLTVGGDGKLTGTAGGYGLYTDKGITINGGTIEVSTYRTSIISSGDVIINDGDITAESEDRFGIFSGDDVTVNGGNVTATGGDMAIRGLGFTVAEGMIIQASTTVDGELGEYVAANLANYKKIVITPPDIYVGGVGMCDGDYLAAGVLSTQTTKPSGGYAYYKDGKLTLNNYSYEGVGYQYNSEYGYYAVIYSKNNLTLELIGSNTLIQTKSFSHTIYVSGASLIVGGTGSLTNTDDGYGFYADQDITINSGTIHSTGHFTGIRSEYGSVVINGGDVTAIGNSGIRAHVKFVANGGTITATCHPNSSTYAIFSNGSVVFASNMTVQASTTADGELGEYVSANHNTYKKIVIKPAASNVLKGDLNDDGSVDNLDVEYLLWHTLFPDEYTLNQDGDFSGDGSVDNLDVEYLLWYTLFPEEYPLN